MNGPFTVVSLIGIGLQAAALAASLGLVAIGFRSLPARIPIRFGFQGRVDAYGSRWWFVALTVLLCGGVSMVWIALAMPQPRHRNVPSEDVAQLAVGSCLALVPVIQYYILEIARGRRVGLPAGFLWKWLLGITACGVAALLVGFAT